MIPNDRQIFPLTDSLFGLLSCTAVQDTMLISQQSFGSPGHLAVAETGLKAFL